MEKKQNQLLESMAVVFNCLLSETIKEEPKDASEKEEKQCKMEVLLTHRDDVWKWFMARNTESI